MSLYVALLRGINVGGKNLIRMTDLKACFERKGYARVATFIQSGNVLFEAPAGGRPALVRAIEATLSETFGYAATVVVRERRELARIVERAPAGFGARPDRYRYDVVFLKEPLAASKAIGQVPFKEGVDEVSAGPGVLYFSRLIRLASQSRLAKLVALPIYRQVTIRNWNTTTKLLALLDALR